MRDAQEQITKHFGIAPLQCPIPPGLETLSLSAERALELRLDAKPYWTFANGYVSIITDDRAEVVAARLKEFTPTGEPVEAEPVE